MVHMRRRGLLWGWWWPACPKLVFDQMAAAAAAAAPEIMNTRLTKQYDCHTVLYHCL
jgi:hypothetical protein